MSCTKNTTGTSGGRDRAFYPLRSGPATSLPAWTYRDAEFLQLELERVLMPSWQIVCHQNDLPEPGDYQVLDILKESIVVVRDSDHSLRAFHNFCRHRGSRLLYGKGCLQRPVITCPYHGWSYGLNGDLRGVPEEKNAFPGLDKSCFGLKPVELDTYLGLVFVRLRDQGGPGLDAMWAPYREGMEHYRLPEMKAVTEIDETEWPCDWKIAVDNNLECYHIMMGHPGLNRMFGLQPENMDVQETGVATTLSRFKDTPSPVWTERIYQERIVKAATHLPAERRDAWAFYTMIPNLGLDLYPDSIDFFQLLPVGPERCVARYCVYALPGQSEEMQSLRRLNMRISGKVMEEDDALCRRVADGVQSSAYEPGPLSVYESPLVQFHDAIRDVLPVARLPEKPRGRPLADINDEMLNDTAARAVRP
jgi:phenylpropionate dioxygenase-like ring-hydroxylating dioxygenase large terminal subunit